MATQKELIEDMIAELSQLRQNLPNGNIVRIEKALVDMQQHQLDMKSDISDIKLKILDPENGIVVKVNKNTDFRYEADDKQSDYDKQLVKLESVLTWKNSVSRALWIIYSAIIGLIIKMLFY